MKKKYLDSSVFIYPLLYRDQTAKFFENVLLDLAKGKFKGFTSTLTWDEVIHILRKKKGKEIAISEGKKFLRFPNLEFVNANSFVISNAQKILEKNNLSPRDAIHVSSALAKGINEIISGDKDFDKVKEIKRIGFKD